MTSQLTELQTHWTPIAPIFSLRNEADYDAAVARLNALLDEVGTNEKHPLYSIAFLTRLARSSTPTKQNTTIFQMPLGPKCSNS